MNTALILFETNPAFREEIKCILNGYNIIYYEDGNTASIDTKTAGDISIILGNPKTEFLKLCPNLKWIQLASAGANEYVNGELNQSVQLTCASGCYGHAVSEEMMALTLALYKKLHLYRDQQFTGSWQSRGAVKSIQGAVVLVIGVGDIGTNYAKRMKALGCYVIGVDINAYVKPDFLDELHLMGKLDDMLSRADVVALGVPGTKATKNLIGRTQFAKMKQGSVFINCCRGFIVDTEALCDALVSGRLSAAGLDVTEPEPLPPKHRLWTMENALITPHVAGGRHLQETFEYIMRLCLRNARHFICGETLESLVDYKTGFRIPISPVVQNL